MGGEIVDRLIVAALCVAKFVMLLYNLDTAILVYYNVTTK